MINHWWENIHILRHIREKMCGSQIATRLGLPELMANLYASRFPFEQDVSVGAGKALKEIDLTEGGLVSEFSLVDLSQSMITIGDSNLENRGLRSVRYHYGNYAEVLADANSFDLVYWDSALHHMSDVEHAIRWSHRVLKPGGVFFYVRLCLANSDAMDKR